MRNIFDQYTQPENRLTHALVCTLNADRALIRPFLRWAGARNIPKVRDIRITEQQVPGEMTPGEEDESRGLPDACIFTDDGWVMLIESKVQSGIATPQINRHFATARRYGFESPCLLLLSVDGARSKLPKQASHRFWRDLYSWLRGRSRRSKWANTLSEYMEQFEARMIANDYSIRGTLTMFDGLRFDADNPYTYREGKRLIRLLGDELRKRKELKRIGIDTREAGRSRITGRDGTGVWDYLPLMVARKAAYFTDVPHVDMGLHQDRAFASVVVPNGVRGGFRTKLRNLGQDGWIELLSQLHRRARSVLRRSKGSRALVRAAQRHYLTQSVVGGVDARVEADLRTIVPGSRSVAKFQPQWAVAIYEALTHKRSNIQLELSVELSYRCPIVRSPKAVDLFAESWIAMSPLIDFVIEE